MGFAGSMAVGIAVIVVRLASNVPRIRSNSTIGASGLGVSPVSDCRLQTRRHRHDLVGADIPGNTFSGMGLSPGGIWLMTLQGAADPLRGVGLTVYELLEDFAVDTHSSADPRQPSPGVHTRQNG